MNVKMKWMAMHALFVIKKTMSKELLSCLFKNLSGIENG